MNVGPIHASVFGSTSLSTTRSDWISRVLSPHNVSHMDICMLVRGIDCHHLPRLQGIMKIYASCQFDHEVSLVGGFCAQNSYIVNPSYQVPALLFLGLTDFSSICCGMQHSSCHLTFVMICAASANQINVPRVCMLTFCLLIG